MYRDGNPRQRPNCGVTPLLRLHLNSHIYGAGHLVTTTFVQPRQDNQLSHNLFIPGVKMLHSMRGDNWLEEIQIGAKLT